MKNYKIIDNFLDIEIFKSLKLQMSKIPWYYNDSVTFKNNSEQSFYFTHLFYEYYYQDHIQSDFYEIVKPLIEKISPTALIRVKGNMYTNIGYKAKNLFHKDFEYKHNGAVFSINTNNGATILEDGTEILSVANRLLLFDASLPHASVFCDDEKIRLNININFIQ
jgi:hypothetical protein